MALFRAVIADKNLEASILKNGISTTWAELLNKGGTARAR